VGPLQVLPPHWPHALEHGPGAGVGTGFGGAGSSSEVAVHGALALQEARGGEVRRRAGRPGGAEEEHRGGGDRRHEERVRALQVRRHPGVGRAVAEVAVGAGRVRRDVVWVAAAGASCGAAATAAPELSPEALSKDTTISQPKKPTLSMSSTGAIPKSISFDKTVVMNSRQTKDESPVSSSSELDPGVKSNVDSSHPVDAGTRGFPHKQRGDKSFFKSWKLPKIGRHRGGEHSGGTRNLGVDALLSTNEDTMVTPDGILTPTLVESTAGAVPSASVAALLPRWCVVASPSAFPPPLVSTAQEESACSSASPPQLRN